MEQYIYVPIKYDKTFSVYYGPENHVLRDSYILVGYE